VARPAVRMRGGELELEVLRDGRALALGGARQRGVLALLLLHTNEAVSADRLTTELWGEGPPGDASAALQAHVSRLRKVLAPDAPIETAAAGYRLRVAAAARALGAALELWRGPPLADLEGEPFAEEAIRTLQERRLAAVELRIDAELARRLR